MRAFLKNLPVPAFLGGGLWAGWTGDLPVIGAAMEDALSSIDVWFFQGLKYPSVFVFFSGLTTAWVVYLIVSLVIYGKKQRALIRLGEVWEDGVDFRVIASRRLPPLTTADKAKIKDFENEIIRNVGIISKPSQSRFRRLNTIHWPDHPPEVRLSARGGEMDLGAFSEMLKRADEFIQNNKA